MGFVAVFFPRVRNCFGDFLFPFCFLFNLLFCPFPLQFAAFWSWKLPSQRYCNILEFEALIFHGIRNILVLKLFMLDGMGSNLGLLRFVVGFFRIGFGLFFYFCDWFCFLLFFIVGFVLFEELGLV